MDFIFSLGKELLLLLVWALIQAPFLRLSARLTKTSNVTLKAAFTLGLIVSAAATIVSLVLYPLHMLIGDRAAESLSFIAAIATTVWLFGYFLRGENGSSIGMWRGCIVFGLTVLLLFAVGIVVALLAVLVFNILK